MTKTALGSLRYITAQEFRDALLNAHREGQCTPELIDIFTVLVRKMGAQANFRNYSYLEDMVQAAIAQCCFSWHKFDISKAYPHAYFSQVAYNAFRHILNIEAKQREVVKALQREYGLPEFGHADDADSEGGDTD